jgi:hypothetical protein
MIILTSDMSYAISLLSLPPEIIRVIVINMDLFDLPNFQGSSSIIRSATSDVSFCSQHLLKHYPTRVIRCIYKRRYQVSNWKEVVARLYHDKVESVYYFYENKRYKHYTSKSVVPPFIRCDFKQVGYKMGVFCVSILGSASQ